MKSGFRFRYVRDMRKTAFLEGAGKVVPKRAVVVLHSDKVLSVKSAADEGRKRVLFECRYGAGVKAQRAVERVRKFRRKNHIAYPERRRKRFGKRIYVDDAAVLVIAL